MSIGQIKEELAARWHDTAIVSVCLRIIDHIAALPVDQRRMLSFSAICRAAEKDNVDDELLTALNILVSSKIAALDARALLIDDDESEHELDPETLANARATGQLIHPDTGEIVPEFETRVIPFFVPSDRFDQ